jgi:Putative zinc-finger
MSAEPRRAPRGEGPANPLRITCADAVELGTLYLDGALGERDREDYEVHLSLCNPCSAFLAQLRRTVELTRRLVGEQPADSEMVEKLVRRFAERDPGPGL